MAKDELIDDRVSLKQCKQAVDALLSHVSQITAKKAETQLLPDAEQSFWLTVALKKQPQTSSLKVFSIPVAYPIVDPRKESVCLITKDPQRTYKDLLEDNNIRFIHKVVGIAKLKGKYKAYDARRALLKEHGLFLADDRVIPLLPKLLGSKFFEAKKQPLPINITRKDLKKELERAVSSTYMPSIRGTSLSIKVGKLSQTAAQVVANIQTALPAVAARVNGGWDNIQSLGLKTSNSVNLPLWSCSLDDSEGGRWAGFAAENEENEDYEEESAGEEDNDEDEEAELDDDEFDGVSEDEGVDMVRDDKDTDTPGVVQITKSKGKKRAADTDRESELVENPKKKKSKKNFDTFTMTSSVTEHVDIPSKSKKPQLTVSTPAKKIPMSTSSAKELIPPSNFKTEKASVPEAPTPVNTPANMKKATVEKLTTKKNSANVVAATIDLDTSAPKRKKKDKKAASAGISHTPAALSASESVSVEPKNSKKPRASQVAIADAFTSVPASSEPGSSLKNNVTVEVKSKEVESAPKAEGKRKEKKKVNQAFPGGISEALAGEAEMQDEMSKQSNKEKKGQKDKKAKLSSDGAPETELADLSVADTEKGEKGEQKKGRKEKKRKDPVEGAAVALEDDIVMDHIPVLEKNSKKEKKSMAINKEEVLLTSGEEPKQKKGKKSRATDKEQDLSALSRDELKRKKNEAPGEKKKSKALKAKGGPKSAKDSLLKKRVL